MEEYIKVSAKTVEDAVKVSEEGKPKAKKTVKRFETTTSVTSTESDDAFATSWAIIENELADIGKGGK